MSEGGVNIKLHDRQIETNKKLRNKVLFVGRDFVRKGGPQTLSAFCYLKKHLLPSAELIIAGPKTKPYEGDIPGVTFYGDISFEKTSELMNDADLFCLPSKFEAYGLVFIEALAAGVPCIGRDAWEMPYFIKKGVNGDLIIGNSVKELAESMYKVLSDEQIYKNVMTQRTNLAEEYSWTAVANRMFDVFQKDGYI